MRIICAVLLLFFFSGPSLAEEIVFPERQGAISDTFDVVTPATKQQVQALVDELRKVTSINMALVVVRTTRPLDPEQYGRTLYEKWDVGQKERGLDHGVLILIAVLDREVRLITGKSLDFLFYGEKKDSLAMGLYPLLGRGKIDEATYFAAATVSAYILNEWPKYHQEGRRLDFERVSKTAFILSAIAILLTLIYGGTFITAFSTIVGGLVGYFLLDIPGMLVAAAMAFLLTMRRVERKMSQAEKELKVIYDKWKTKNKDTGGKENEAKS